MEENATGSTSVHDEMAELIKEKRVQQQIREADPTRIETVAEKLNSVSGEPKGPRGVMGMAPRAWRPGITAEQKKKRNAKRKAQKQARKRNR
jgi:hypothetical protein